MLLETSNIQATDDEETAESAKTAEKTAEKSDPDVLSVLRGFFRSSSQPLSAPRRRS
jgi:hypothetical protein